MTRERELQFPFMTRIKPMGKEVALLEAWYEKHHRPLPWRKTRDPYRIWISEVMLQQTQVTTVIPYYDRFIKTFPHVNSLAAAKESQVLSLWSGLGYYSRAKNLKKGAQNIVEHYGGAFPITRAELLRIPGIGPYTAGAILSIAFDLPEPIVDGNVYRVFSRYFGFRKCIDLPKHQGFFWKKALEWVKRSTSPRRLNQALMELGATVCTKASPNCAQCPLSDTCIAQKKSLQGVLPVRKARKKTLELHWELALYRKKESVFLIKNTGNSWWAGLWDLPRIKKQKDSTLLCHHTHTVTHHKIHASTYGHEGSVPAELKGKWFSKEKALGAPLSSLSRKILLAALDLGE